MELIYKSGIERLIAKSFLQSLRNFSLFDESHSISCIYKDNILAVNYWTEKEERTANQTKTSISVDNSVGYLLWIQIKLEKRSEGHGHPYTIA